MIQLQFFEKKIFKGFFSHTIREEDYELIRTVAVPSDTLEYLISQLNKFHLPNQAEGMRVRNFKDTTSFLLPREGLIKVTNELDSYNQETWFELRSDGTIRKIHIR